MDPHTITTIGLFLLGGVFTVLWWLLQKKDSAQEEQIRLLFKKHDDDAQRLQDLELKIAGSYYHKEELDKRFDKLDQTFREVAGDISREIRDLSQRLLEHMIKEERA